MKALVTTPDGLDVVDHPDPRPGPGEAVVAVRSCGICGSDVHMVEAGLPPPGQILGHEFAGTVAELGPGVREPRVGTPVAVNPLGGCGSCARCRGRVPLLCGAVPNLGLNAPGGFAEYAAVPVPQLFALPDGMAVRDGAHVEPLAVAVRAVEEARPAPGDDALVFGLGPIGLSVVLALRAYGAGKIVAVGRSPGRRAAASLVGADVVLDGRETSVARYAADAGLAFAAAYECSGDSQALLACIATVEVCGTIVELALGRPPASFDMVGFVTKGLRLLSVCAYAGEEFGRALDLVGSGAVNADPLVSERIPLAEVPAAFERLRAPGHLVGITVEPWR
ncbi:MAG: alcohol dehydrogenase catalytic domain-containing protein [Streptosporangiales bacterium]|nr:alcohol dehydrogenase catalytic domain-containing protein [Streptosporangiales bacterium]